MNDIYTVCEEIKWDHQVVFLSWITQWDYKVGLPSKNCHLLEVKVARVVCGFRTGVTNVPLCVQSLSNLHRVVRAHSFKHRQSRK